MPLLNTLLHSDHGALSFLRRGLRVAVIGVAVALVLTLIYQHTFWPTLTYSICIALGCWLFIDTARLSTARWVHRHDPNDARYGQWPGWPLMALIVPVGTVLGYTVGNVLGNWITGFDNPSLIGVSSVRQALALLVISLIPSVGATYFFYSRGRPGGWKKAPETQKPRSECRTGVPVKNHCGCADSSPSAAIRSAAPGYHYNSRITSFC